MSLADYRKRIGIGVALLFMLAACSDEGGTGTDTGDTESDADSETGTGGNPDSDVDTDSDIDTDTVMDSDNGCGSGGIASKYPGDAGIGDDPSVVYADDFESYVSADALGDNWNGGVYHNVSITLDAANVFHGAKALQFWNPKQDAELSNTVARVLSEEVDTLYLRYYTKYDSSFDVTGSSHNGGDISAHYYQDGQATPGIPADGTNKFLADLECWRGEAVEPKPGSLNIYIYHPEQRSEWGDHFFPDGTVLPWTYLPGDFGTDFVSRPAHVPQLNRWYCHEFMVHANTPGKRDGKISVWVDGALVVEFGNLRLRDVDTLKIDRFSLNLHIAANTNGETWKWYDNVVAATSYIGPMCPP